MVGSDTPPIEFQTLETIPANEAIELEQFFQIIEILKSSFSVSIRMSVLRVSSGKRFLCVQMDHEGHVQLFMLNMGVQYFTLLRWQGRMNGQLSTLILRPINQIKIIAAEQNINPAS